MNDDLFAALIGKHVYVSCGNYAYDGLVERVDNKTNFIELREPRIVYETGEWERKDWQTAFKLPTSALNISMSAIEVIFAVER